ncbi:Cullin [Calycina marina]|uniref:Cullin n=1 Tax=Calycina marina TaxID=1763456 RepID=A0A9P7Z814_9HELO|nr:Cullin [Calycina marina]
MLSSALRQIHEKDAGTLSFESLYRASYKIVLKKQGDQLYDRVKEYEEQWFGSEVMPSIRKLITSNLVNITVDGIAGITPNERRLTGEEFLRGLRDSWVGHQTTMNMATDVLMYMDRVYCTDNRRASIYVTSMGLFRDYILRARLSESTLVTFDILNSVILDQINMEREGDVISQGLIKSCVRMLGDLYESDNELEHEKLYLTGFEQEFLSTSEAYYDKLCGELLREGDTGAWLRQSKKRLTEEKNRCHTTLADLSEAKIANVVEERLVKARMSEFLALDGSGITAMIDGDRSEDLTLLYELVSRVDKTKKPLNDALQARVTVLGAEINRAMAENDSLPAQEPEEADATADGGDGKKAAKVNLIAKQTAAAIRWVDLVLQLKDKFDKIWKECFSEDLVLQTALTNSFSDFINLFPRCSEFVSLFVDDNLKKGIKGKTEAEIDHILDKATTLVRYIQDKDMFERYYKKHLARRLLHSKSESTDVEKQMIARMKQEMGSAFTNKLEGMFKDISMSLELTTDYGGYISNLGDVDSHNIALGINVLNTNYWPMESVNHTVDACQWPPEIKKLQDSFKTFYLKTRNGRALTWLGYLGSADIKCSFPKIPGKEGILARPRHHEINVPTHAMVILLLFNDLALDEYITFEEIQQRTNIPADVLVRILATLAVIPKAKVLNKVPANKELPKPGDKFCFNASFTSKSIKIKAPVIGGATNKVEADEERRETEDRNDEHRASVIDTVLVRIMKARKMYSHQQLVVEVIAQLSARFPPNISMMKRRIESLIEREYLERVENADVPTYKYLA